MSARKPVSVSRPVARDEGLLIEQIGDETVAYDLESKEAHCLKPLAAVVFAHADGRNTTADLAELASYRLGTSVSEDEVRDAVAQLEECVLLDTPMVGQDGVSRRDALRRIAATGVGATLGASLVTTIVAPTALAQGSLIPIGNCCGDSSQGKNACNGLNSTCETSPLNPGNSGHCCQNNSAKQCNVCKCVAPSNVCDIVTNSTGCTLAPNDSCPAGQQCTQQPDGTTACCTVVTTGGGQVINC